MNTEDIHKACERVIREEYVAFARMLPLQVDMPPRAYTTREQCVINAYAYLAGRICEDDINTCEQIEQYASKVWWDMERDYRAFVKNEEKKE